MRNCNLLVVVWLHSFSLSVDLHFMFADCSVAVWRRVLCCAVAIAHDMLVLIVEAMPLLLVVVQTLISIK